MLKIVRLTYWTTQRRQYTMGGIGEADADFDVLIIGAGLSGIFSLYRMREAGLKARVLETGSGEGGTWWWCVSLCSALRP